MIGFKKIKIIFVSILLLFLIWPVFTYAQTPDKATAKQINFTPNVPIGEFKGNIPVDREILGKYLSAWYSFIVGVVGILAAVIIMWGGFKWLTSRGNSAAISDAKDRIWSAVIGLVLVFLSYIILYIINPKLLTISLPETPTVNVTISSGDASPSGQPIMIRVPSDPAREQAMREYFHNNGVNVNAGSNRTQIGNMQQEVAQRVVQFSNDCSAYNSKPCNTIITGGNEHGNQYHITGQATDISPTPEMNNFIVSSVIPQLELVATTNYDGSGNNYPIYLGNYNGQEMRIIDERNKPGAGHWHIEFR